MEKLIDLYKAEIPEHPHWVESGILPKMGRMLLAGKTTMGKTYLVMNMARSLAQGTPLWGIPEFEVPEPVGVLYLDQEVGEYELQRRTKEIFEDMGGPPPNIWYETRVADLVLDTPRGMKQLTDRVDSEESIGVIIVDPISQAMVGDEKDNFAIKKLTHHITKTMERYKDRGLSLVLVHHYKKPPTAAVDKAVYEESAMVNIRGAQKLVDDSEVVITGHRDDNCLPAIERWRILLAFEKIRQGRDISPKTVSVMRTGRVEPGKEMHGMITL